MVPLKLVKWSLNWALRMRMGKLLKRAQLIRVTVNSDDPVSEFIQVDMGPN